MARRKIENRNLRSLTKVSGGTSYGITLPMENIRKLGWRAKQKLEVKLYQDRIIIRDWTPYIYVGNNPILMIDPNGMDWYTTEDGSATMWQDGSDEIEGYTNNGVSFTCSTVVLSSRLISFGILSPM